jgi:hypothetical protein
MDAAIVCGVILCAAYFLAPDAQATEHVDTLEVKIQFLP